MIRGILFWATCLVAGCDRGAASSTGSSGAALVASDSPSLEAARSVQPAAPASSVAAPTDPLAGFVRFASAEGGYEVMLPAAPKESETPMGGDMVVHTSMADDPAWAFAVSWYDLATAPTSTAKVFDDSRNAVLTGLQGKLDGERDFEVAGKPAREIAATIPGGKEFLRMIAVDRRIYSLVVVGKPTDEARAHAFFETFKLKTPVTPAHAK